MDLFIQKNFFSAPWQTALVYDPQSKERGMFAWRRGQTKRVDFTVDDGVGPCLGLREQAGNPVLPDRGPEDDPVPAIPGSNTDILIKLETLERRQRWFLVGMTAVALLAVIWPLVALTVVPGILRGPPQAPSPAAVPSLPDLSEYSTPGGAGSVDGAGQARPAGGQASGERKSDGATPTAAGRGGAGGK
jgi:hypothetical protein